MQSGPEQFKEWMRKRGFKQADAARFLSFDEPYVSVLLSGKRSPGLENACHIEELTGIPARAWLVKDLDNSDEPFAEVAAKGPVV